MYVLLGNSHVKDVVFHLVGVGVSRFSDCPVDDCEKSSQRTCFLDFFLKGVLSRNDLVVLNSSDRH